ncbi:MULTISPECIES: trypco2 family protein [Dactylosporangium]|uniref:Trypsin-co-occurring domain-containing protein n=2 Tax=Dactylosporangium TaxID=35753 RepID=A0A9W6KIR9_9ACTN|nr:MULTISPECIES: trypco2 family protein [Dactylosporangium]UAC00178.1 hypothetical protein Dvina_20225 [Dactylosporangium vinaceum]GLL02273.1 hypothetical protein GCM10017581_040150 [Dactylosporangium matsuzakiense]
MDDAIQLADMIWQLRHELSRAMWAGEHTDLKFEAETVQLELTVAVERSQDPGVKVKFWVLDMNAGAKRASTATQKIALTLHPVRPDAPGRPAVISGAALPGEG